MKIFKVTLDPSNPVEKIVKVPVGSNYGIQINWNYEKYPTFVGTDINTENGFLTDSLGKIEENTSFTEVNGQKIFTGLHVIEEVGNTIVLYYGKNETFDDNKLDNFGSIKVVGIDSDDYDVDANIESISFENNELTLSAQTIDLNGTVMINGEEYQSGSSVDYMHSQVNVKDSNKINLFIGNNYDGQKNDIVYINGKKINIGQGSYRDDGKTGASFGTADFVKLFAFWAICLDAQTLCLETTNLDFCIDTNSGGSWKINGYKINLDQFLSQYGEYEG